MYSYSLGVARIVPPLMGCYCAPFALLYHYLLVTEANQIEAKFKDIAGLLNLYRASLCAPSITLT